MFKSNSSIIFWMETNFLSKINPGSNVYGDNDVQTARPGGLQEADILEPMIDDHGKLHCPICSEVFNSREAYISHSLSKHQTIEETKETMETGKETMEMGKETMEQNKNRGRAILASVPYDHGFHFFTDMADTRGKQRSVWLPLPETLKLHRLSQ